ncbi:TauD/TfdA family dioxygenase [Rhodobacteraceae bacterium NNCM2]|nr:TauD/TfdA family dioxygenase [Coraliihabitans acroporae]
MSITPLTGGLGAEIFGADIREPEQFPTVASALADYGVIAIRDQQISPDDQVAFAERFNPINVNRFFAKVPGHPRVAMVLKEPGQNRAIGEDWHTDHSYDEIPAMCSILHCIETPEVGGDTCFSSMNAAYESLSSGLKSVLHGLKAWHSSRHVFGAMVGSAETRKDGRIGNAEAATQDSLHPVVIKHPLSGKPCLYVNPEFTTHIDGWTKAESEALLGHLYKVCQNADFHCRVRYRPGTVVIWDNRATWHKAINDYPNDRRLMHRVTVEGCALEPAFSA